MSEAAPNMISAIQEILSSSPDGSRSASVPTEDSARDAEERGPVTTEQVSEKAPSEQEPEPEPGPESEAAEQGEGQAEGEEEEFDEETGPPEKEGGKWSWDEKRARRIYEGYKQAQEFRRYFESPKEAAEHLELSRTLVAMWEDLNSGEPEAIQRFTSYWSRQSPEGFRRLIASLPEIAPDQWEAAETELMELTAARLYAASKRERDPDHAARLLAAAQVMEYLATGQYTPAEEVPDPPDPAELERSEIEQERQRIEQERQRLEMERIKMERDEVEGRIRERVDQWIEATLEPLGAIKTQRPKLWEAALSLARRTVREAVAGSRDGEKWITMYKEHLKRPAPEGRAKLIDSYLDLVRRAAERSIRQIVRELGNQVGQETAQAARRSAEASQKARRDVPGTKSPSSPVVENPDYQEARKKRDLEGAIKSLMR